MDAGAVPGMPGDLFCEWNHDPIWKICEQYALILFCLTFAPIYVIRITWFATPLLHNIKYVNGWAHSRAVHALGKALLCTHFMAACRAVPCSDSSRRCFACIPTGLVAVLNVPMWRRMFGVQILMARAFSIGLGLNVVHIHM